MAKQSDKNIVGMSNGNVKATLEDTIEVWKEYKKKLQNEKNKWRIEF